MPPVPPLGTLLRIGTYIQSQISSCLQCHCNCILLTDRSLVFVLLDILCTTGWLISSVTSFIKYKISYTQAILVIMVFRDCNSIILNDFKRFFESKTWNCVLYGYFYGGKMCPSTQRKSSIRAHCFSNNLSRVFKF